MKSNDWGIMFWTHLILIILLWLTPILVNWKLILLGIIAWYLQLLIIGDCVLTRKQFNTKKRSVTFYWYYGRKIFPKLDMMKVKYYTEWVFPYIILGLAIIIQELLRLKPILF